MQERDGAILKVTLNDPDTRNALTDTEQFEELVALSNELRTDYSVKVVILTGAGASFCAGGNIKDMASRSGIFGGSPYELRESYRNGIQRIPTALYNLDVPIIAAINGHAIGAGLDLTCMCDIRIASQKAKFAESFVKLGIVPGDGGAWLLPRVIGMPKASIMALTGDMIDAEKALEWGLVTEVVPEVELQQTAYDLAQRIASNPAHSLRLTKRLLREGQHMRLDSLLEMSAAYQSIAHHTEDHSEAVSAFLQKRKPAYNNK
ncbi:crotonase/enoyl-CoA hydratase family protein [Pseudomaricurvus hydrocarbonicus]